jgi:hypothetical protein
MLLRDVKTIFTNRDSVALGTAELLTDLRGIPESLWAVLGKDQTGLTPRGLATFLRRYGIKSKNIRIMGRIVKGYERGQFADAWNRYPSPTSDDESSPSSGKSATSATFDESADQTMC